jgi:prolyl oligopeptidase
MRMTSLRTAVFALTLAALTPAFAADRGAPQTRRVPVTDVLQGVTITDPYRWLEDAADPQVEAWSDAQNARARKVLDAIPGRTEMRTTLKQLITATSSSHSDLHLAGGKLFAMFSDPSKQQPLLVVMSTAADPASQRIVLDPNALDAKGGIAIDWYVPSPDGSRVALSLSQGGSEDGTLHMIDVATGKEIDKPIPAVQYPTAGGTAAWTADSQALWYTRFPGPERAEADRHFYQQVYFHRLGADAAKDPLVLGEKDGLPRIAEVILDNRYTTKAVLASVQLGDGGKFAHWVLYENGTKQQVSGFDDQVVAAVIGPDDGIYMISRAGAPKGKVLKASLTDPQAADAKLIVPAGNDAIVSDSWQRSLTLSKDRLFVTDIIGGPNQVRVFDHDGKQLGKIPLPDVSAVDQIEALPDGDVLYSISTYLRPRYYARWSAASHKSAETKLQVTSPVKFDDAEVVRTFATSKDGTKVPVNIIRRKGTVLNGDNATLLYGYGGYGINLTPHFLGPRWRLWLDAGAIYAEANIRGGGEYGEDWHRQGALTNKQNVFDDFAAAAKDLIDKKYTRPEKLALMGGSNGGLLMGALITQHPELADTVVSQVGIYDMLRVELDPNGAFNTQEFGTVKDPAQFKALYAYSPYHHVKDGVKYPAVLMMTGANDGRVNPMQSRKFAAALQAATASDAPILLRVSKNSGHGIGSSLDERVDEQADTLAFLYERLGLHWKGSRPGS